MEIRVEVWMNDKIEWSLEGNGSIEQFKQAGMKIRSYFPEEKINLVIDKENVTSIYKTQALDEVILNLQDHNVMLCDSTYNTMMVFIKNEGP